MKTGSPGSRRGGGEEESPSLGTSHLLPFVELALWSSNTAVKYSAVAGLSTLAKVAENKRMMGSIGALECLTSIVFEEENPMKSTFMAPNDMQRKKEPSATSKKVKALDGRVRYHHIRMLSYIRGLPVNEIEEPSKELLYNMGVFVANVGRALRRFDHEAVHRTHLWDMQQFMAIKDFIPHVGEQKHKNLVLRVLGGFQMTVLQNAENLPKQIIHNDMNDTNLLVIKQKGKLAFAVIDWGDMVQSWRVNEIACSMAYTMLNKDDPIDAALHVLQGYLSKTPLKDVEWTVLYWCIAARLATSCTMSAYSYSLDRSNKYLLHTAEPGWAALATLLAMTPKQFLEKVKLRHQKHKEQMAAAKKRGGASGAKKESDIEMNAKNLTGNRRSFVRVSNLKPHEA